MGPMGPYGARSGQAVGARGRPAKSAFGLLRADSRAQESALNKSAFGLQGRSRARGGRANAGCHLILKALMLLLLVQAGRARPMRGEVSQASQGLVHTTHVLLGLSHFDTFFGNLCLETNIFLDVFLKRIRYQDLIRLIIWSRMH